MLDYTAVCIWRKICIPLLLKLTSVRSLLFWPDFTKLFCMPRQYKLPFDNFDEVIVERQRLQGNFTLG